MSLQKSRFSGVVVLAVAVLVAASATANAKPTQPPVDEFIEIGGTEVAASLGVTTQGELDAALLSGGVSVLIDADTGDIISVTDLSTSVTPNSVSWVNTCTASQFCLTAWSVPYSNVGFTGTGTTTGTWGGKGGVRANGHTGQAWWTSNLTGQTLSTPKIAGTTIVSMNESTTFTKVQLWS